MANRSVESHETIRIPATTARPATTTQPMMVIQRGSRRFRRLWRWPVVAAGGGAMGASTVIGESYGSDASPFVQPGGILRGFHWL